MKFSTIKVVDESIFTIGIQSNAILRELVRRGGPWHKNDAKLMPPNREPSATTQKK